MTGKSFHLDKKGRSEVDFIDNPEYFHFLMTVYDFEKNKKSFPFQICNELFDCSNLINITKSNEYQKILRYAKRLEDLDLIDSKKDKKKTYFDTFFHITNFLSSDRYCIASAI